MSQQSLQLEDVAGMSSEIDAGFGLMSTIPPNTDAIQRACEVLLACFADKGKSWDDARIMDMYTRIRAIVDYEIVPRNNYLQGVTTDISANIPDDMHLKHQLISLTTFALAHTKELGAPFVLDDKYVRVITIALFYFLRCMFRSESALLTQLYGCMPNHEQESKLSAVFTPGALYPCISTAVWEFIIVYVITSNPETLEAVKNRYGGNLPTDLELSLAGDAARLEICTTTGVDFASLQPKWRYSKEGSPLHKPEVVADAPPTSVGMRLYFEGIDNSIVMTKLNTHRHGSRVKEMVDAFRKELEEADNLIAIRRCVAKITDLCVSSTRSLWSIEDDLLSALCPSKKRSRRGQEENIINNNEIKEKEEEEAREPNEHIQ